jgi:plasmid stability protein
LFSSTPETIEFQGAFLHTGGGDAMATLIIENFPDSLYQQLQERAERGRRSVEEEVIHILDHALDRGKTLSMMGLEGLGKEIWEGIDAAEYIRRERDSWDS